MLTLRIVLRRQRNSLLLLPNLPRSKLLPHLRLRRLPRLGRRKLAFRNPRRLHNRHFRAAQFITFNVSHDGHIHVFYRLQLLYPRNPPHGANRMYCVGYIPVWRRIFPRRRTGTVYIFRRSVSALRQIVRHVPRDRDDVVLQFYLGYDLALAIIPLHDRGRFRVVRRLERCRMVVNPYVYAGDKRQNAGRIRSGVFGPDEVSC